LNSRFTNNRLILYSEHLDMFYTGGQKQRIAIARAIIKVSY